MTLSNFLKITILLWLFIAVFSYSQSDESPPPIITTDNITHMEQQHVLGQGVILNAVYSPNGNELAVQKATGIWIYDVHDMQAPPRFLSDYLGWGMVYHPDGQLLAMQLSGGIVVIDAATGRLHYPIFVGENIQIRNMRFSPDGRYLVGNEVDHTTTTEKAELSFWDAQTGAFIFRLDASTESQYSAVLDIAIHPTSDFVALSIYDGRQKIRVWDMRTYEWVYDISVGNDILYPQSIWHTPDGQLWSMTATGRKSVWLWDVMTGELVKEIVFDDYIRNLSFHPTEPMMMVTMLDHLHLVDIHTGQIHNTFSFPTRLTEGINCHYHPQGASGLCLSSGVWQDSRTLNRILWLFDVVTGEITTALYAPYLVNVVYEDANTLNAFTPELTRQVWDIATGEMVSDEQLETVPPIGAYHQWGYYAYPRRAVGDYVYWQYIPEQDWLFSLSDRQLDMRDSQTHTLIQSFPTDLWSFASIAVHPDGQSFALAGSHAHGERYDVIQLWDVEGDLLHSIALADFLRIRRVFYSADGQTLYAAMGRHFYTIDLATYEQTELFISDKQIGSAFAYLEDTSLAFLGRDTGEIDVVNLQTGAWVHTLYGHVDKVTSAILSDDERWLVTSSLDGTIRLWGISD